MVESFTTFYTNILSAQFKPEPKKSFVITCINPLARLSIGSNIGTIGNESEQRSPELICERTPGKFQQISGYDIVPKRTRRIVNRFESLWPLKVGANIVFKVHERSEA